MDCVTFGVRVAGVIVVISAPASLAATLADFYKLAQTPPVAGAPTITIEGEAADYTIIAEKRIVARKLTLGGVLAQLADLLPEIARPPGEGVWLRAAALGWEDKVALIAGRTRVGRSALVSWLVDRGFSCQGSEYAFVARDDGRVAGLAGPLIVADPAMPTVAKLEAFRDLAAADGDDSLIVAPAVAWRAAQEWARCGLVVVAEFAPGAEFVVEALDFERDQALLATALSPAFAGKARWPARQLSRRAFFFQRARMERRSAVIPCDW